MEEIRELIQLVDNTCLEELELEREGFRIRLKKQLARAERAAERPEETVAVPSGTKAANEMELSVQEERAVQKSDAFHEIVSPMVGTFYRAPAPDADPYVQVGDRVNKETVVCIVEAMKLMNEIEAEVEGEIVEILVENGQLVEYGQPLFLVKT